MENARWNSVYAENVETCESLIRKIRKSRVLHTCGITRGTRGSRQREAACFKSLIRIFLLGDQLISA